MKTLTFMAGAVAFATLFTGCTMRLWQTDNFTSYRYPSPDPRLAVMHDAGRHDYVACYDELSDKKGTVERRAYLVLANGDVTERGQKPAYLAAIPTDLPPLARNPLEGAQPYFTETNAVFVIHTPDAVLGPMRLPTYQENSGLATKVALTPLTVIADVAIVGIVAGLMFPGLWTGVASH